VQDHSSPCSGIAVPWKLGSVWTTYPYQCHLGSIGWTPIAFSKKRNEITICADNCEGQSNQLNGSCRKCTALPDSVKFRDFVQQAFNASDHTQWDYLSSEQLQSLLTKANQNCRRLRTQLSNSQRHFSTLGRKLDDYKRILMMLSSNDVAGLRHLLGAAH